MATIIPVAPFDYVVFGATGDLTQRKLLPALYHRYRDGQIPQTSRIIGASRSDLSSEKFRQRAHEAVERYVDPADLDAEKLSGFLDHLDYVPMDATGDTGWETLKSLLDERPDQIRPYYLATSPDLYGAICRNLDRYGLIGEHSRVVLEKPIGKDLKSAQAINDAVGAVFPESQIFRIDHYLGKETVQNLLALRFANTIFERLWNADVIDHVQITVGETVGVEGRGGYYDTSGALRDMVQNHMLQLLCLVALESPNSMDADAIRTEKLKVLSALRRIGPGDVASKTVRGQYKAGLVNGAKAPAYAEEVGKPTRTETFVAIKAEVDNWRWAGVPFYLRTGKRMGARRSEIVVQFKDTPVPIFGVGAGAPNKLVLRLQPDEGVRLWLNMKEPGPGGLRVKTAPLDLSFAEEFGGVRYPDAYERLLMDVVRGNLSLFMRRDEVDAAWTWADALLAAWDESGAEPYLYAAGSNGPTQSALLLDRDGRAWWDPE